MTGAEESSEESFEEKVCMFGDGNGCAKDIVNKA